MTFGRLTVTVLVAIGALLCAKLWRRVRFVDTASAQGIERGALIAPERNALAILETLPVDNLNVIRDLLHLPDPRIITPTTLTAFTQFCVSPPMKFDLSDAGVSAFKRDKRLANSGSLQGVIGAQTASYYYNAILERAREAHVTGRRTINQAGMELIKEFEGCAKTIPGTESVTTYLDAIGVPTIGYGHTGRGVTIGLIITRGEAQGLLESDLVRFEKYVEELVTVTVTDNQFAVLVSFAYNLGPGVLRRSSLLKCLNAGDSRRAAGEFLKFDSVHGKKLPGLTRRRKAEQTLFLTPA